MTETITEMVLDMPVRIDEFGPDRKMRPHIWLDYMQHIAAAHAARLGFGMDSLKEHSMIWILSRIKLHINQSPAIDDIIRLQTYPNGVDRLFAKRQFCFTSAITGELLGYASSFWLVLEMPAMRLRSPAEMGVPSDINADKQEFFATLEKLHGTATEAPIPHTISASHIDLNNHLNNTYYCEYAADWLAAKLNRPVAIEEIQLNYNRAMQFGEQLVVSGSIEGNLFYVEGVDASSGKNSFQATGLLF